MTYWFFLVVTMAMLQEKLLNFVQAKGHGASPGKGVQESECQYTR
jgi:hypothetical protein